MPNFTLNDLEGWDVRDGTSSKNYDAWVKAEEATFAYNWEKDFRLPKATTSKPLTAVQPQRSIKSEQSLTIYYQDLSQDNMLRPKGLLFMKTFETQLLTLNEWLDHCLLIQDSNAAAAAAAADPWSCKSPTSIVSEKTSTLLNLKSASTPTASQVHALLQWIHDTTDVQTTTVVNTFDSTNNVSSAVRSKFHFGLPLKDFATSMSDTKQQGKRLVFPIESTNNHVWCTLLQYIDILFPPFHLETIVKKEYIHKGLAKQAESVLDTMMAEQDASSAYQICTVTCDPLVHDFRIMFDYSGLSGQWAMRQLSMDGPLAGKFAHY